MLRWSQRIIIPFLKQFLDRKDTRKIFRWWWHRWWWFWIPYDKFGLEHALFLYILYFACAHFFQVHFLFSFICWFGCLVANQPWSSYRHHLIVPNQISLLYNATGNISEHTKRTSPEHHNQVKMATAPPPQSFAINSTEDETKGITPFELEQGKPEATAPEKKTVCQRYVMEEGGKEERGLTALQMMMNVQYLADHHHTVHIHHHHAAALISSAD